MTTEEYFEGLGCSPDEVQVCAAASRARFRRAIAEAAAVIGSGCILVGDPDGREIDRWREEAAAGGR